jgi:pimeloyl-ACP methyl ester carboxylesterase
MVDIVMVAAGWHGGWALTPVARELRARGHQVFTPTLTGLGERSHLSHAAINLDTHIEDIVNVVKLEQLSDVVLCGHSYAGMVITGVADRLPEHIASLVYIDAFVPQDGESWWDLAGDRYRQIAINGSKADGLAVTPPGHLDPRCRPQPMGSFLQAIRLTGRWQSVQEKLFIYASGWPETPFASTYERLLADSAWTVKSLPTRHNIVRDAPDDLISILSQLNAITSKKRSGENARN